MFGCMVIIFHFDKYICAMFNKTKNIEQQVGTSLVKASFIYLHKVVTLNFEDNRFSFSP